MGRGEERREGGVGRRGSCVFICQIQFAHSLSSSEDQFSEPRIRGRDGAGSEAC